MTGHHSPTPPHSHSFVSKLIQVTCALCAQCVLSLHPIAFETGQDDDIGNVPAYSAQAMASLRLDGFSEEEKRQLVHDVFEDNIDFLSEKLDADQYVNALRGKRSLTQNHAEEIFQATTMTRKNTILLSALRRSDDPLRALSNLIDVVNSKGYQPHVVKQLSQSFARKKRDFRESRGSACACVEGVCGGGGGTAREQLRMM